jgi:uncharacterized membrane protein SpoIIM required for sporulation
MGFGLGCTDSSKSDENKNLSLTPVQNLSIWSIYKMNLLVALHLILGCITLGISTALSLLHSGYNIGNQTYIIAQSLGIKNTIILGSLHGIIEIIALFIASAIGFTIPYALFRYLVEKEEHTLSKQDIMNLADLIFLLFLLLFIAAIIESRISFPLLRRWIEYA